MRFLTPFLLATHSPEFYQAIVFSIGLLVVLAIFGWIWLRDELNQEEE
jgi:uncharacterized membrane protein YciS (DUF1049 family)